MYNKIILAGNLTRDIEIRYTKAGKAIGNTGLATTRKFKGQDGQQKEEVLFVDITFFGRSAEVANQYLRKGSKILVDGRLKLDSWTASDGSKRSKHSVTVETMTMLGSKGDTQTDSPQQPAPQNHGYGADHTPNNNNGYNSQPAPTQQVPQSSGNLNMPEIDINEDEIPF